jgi:hypothetical protein
LHFLERVADIVKPFLGTREYVRQPEFKSEKIAFARTVIESQVKKSDLHFFCPVCPDYGFGESFYKNLGTGISPEAEGAIKFVKYSNKVSKEVGVISKFTIMVADTEDDIPEIIDRVASGSADLYKEKCKSSVDRILSNFENDESVEAVTFGSLLGKTFRDRQYRFEEILKSYTNKDLKFRDEVKMIGNQRFNRHSQILGREELGFELTFRYMAQYAALGSILKQENVSGLLLANYSTPNRKFFNAAENVSKDIRLLDSDTKVIPVLGTIVRR